MPVGSHAKSPIEFWQAKLQANAERDTRQQEELRRLGWNVLVVWECELRHSEQLENKLKEFLEDETK